MRSSASQFGSAAKIDVCDWQPGFVSPCRVPGGMDFDPRTPSLSRLIAVRKVFEIGQDLPITEFSEQSNGRELDEGERVALRFSQSLASRRQRLSQAMVRSTDEALHPGSLDGRDQDAGQGAVKDRALIGAVGEHFPEKGKQTEQGRQQRETAVAILNVGGGDDAVQQQALRIDQNMPLLALDQLAGIEAVAVDASPPFSALFTL